MDIFEAFKLGKIPCMNCGLIFDTVIERRKHDLAFHYDFVLMQCHDNHELLKKWASENY